MKFRDSEHWNYLAEKYLPSFNLPRWSKPYAEDEFLQWMARLNLTPTNFREIYACTPSEFDNLNHWPLRAMVGLMLEARESLEERNGYANLLH